MAKWTNYFKIVTPAASTVHMTDSQEMADVGAYNNYTWYQRLVQGSASRMTRYREYDMMDNDVEVSRALDVIAEEMTGNHTRLDDLFEIQSLSSETSEVNNINILTVQVALRRWIEVHGWENKLFPVARLLIKYGDVFFRKSENNFSKWSFVHPKNVVAAIVDSNDATKVTAWQVKKDMKRPLSGGYSMPLGARQDTQYDTEIIEAKDMVRFTLNDDMSDTAPFGESVLRPVYRSHKQKELLEDAIIIYRVQRAPERRVFYIDVGKMPPQRVKNYLETIKNEIKQKKVPSMAGGQEQIDSVYNPQSMCLALNTKIPLLDGRIETLQTLIDEFNDGKENWAYSINPDTGDVVPGPISWAGITRMNTQTINLTLDNGRVITCTPDHKFPVQGQGITRVMAKDLTPGDMLWSFNVKHEPLSDSEYLSQGLYTSVYNPGSRSWKFVHMLVANYLRYHHGLMKDREYVFDQKYAAVRKTIVHHMNLSSLDNRPSNLTWMNIADHNAYHQSLIPLREDVEFSNDVINRFLQISEENINANSKELLALLVADHTFVTAISEDRSSTTFDQKAFNRLINYIGFDSWREYQQFVIQTRLDATAALSSTFIPQQQLELFKFVVNLIRTVSGHKFVLVDYFKRNQPVWQTFCTLYGDVFSNNRGRKKLSIPDGSIFETIAKNFGYHTFNHMVSDATYAYRTVVKIEEGEYCDTGTLTIDKTETFHPHHTFALDAGCFTFNSEDFFFASRPDGKGSRVETLPGGCFDLSTTIPLLDGRELTLREIIAEHESGQSLWVYSTNPNTGEIVPGKVDWAGITHQSAEVWEITLDNGRQIVATPDHKFPVWGRGFVRLDQLDPTDSLIHFETRAENISRNSSTKQYLQVYDHKKQDWTFVHRMVVDHLDQHGMTQTIAEDIDAGVVEHEVIHHVDVNRFNNNPENLAWMSRKGHFCLHGKLGKLANSKRLAKQQTDSVWKSDVYTRSGQTLRNRLKQPSDFRTKRIKHLDSVRCVRKNVELTFCDDMLTIVRYLFDDCGIIEQQQMVDQLNATSEFVSLWYALNSPDKKVILSEDKRSYQVNNITPEFKIHHLDLLLKEYGYVNWADFKHERLTCTAQLKEDAINYTSSEKIELLKLMVSLTKHHYKPHYIIKYLESNPDIWTKIQTLFNKLVSSKRAITSTNIWYHHFDRISEVLGFANYKDFLSKKALFNHNIVSVRKLDTMVPVGTLTIDQKERYHNYHTFALSAGIFTKNSGLGELSDLEYFQRKVWRGLRVPASYMVEQNEGGAPFSDGKVGVAYIQELRFALFVMRLQGYLEKTIDEEFKKFLVDSNIHIDSSTYKIRCLEPSNFGKYRQYELDTALLSSFGAADGIEYLSKRFALNRFLMLTDEEIIRNERLKREELGLSVDGGKEDYPTLYGGGGAGEGALGGGFGGPIGGGLGGMELGMDTTDPFDANEPPSPPIDSTNDTGGDEPPPSSGTPPVK